MVGGSVEDLLVIQWLVGQWSTCRWLGGRLSVYGGLLVVGDFVIRLSLRGSDICIFSKLVTCKSKSKFLKFGKCSNRSSLKTFIKLSTRPLNLVFRQCFNMKFVLRNYLANLEIGDKPEWIGFIFPC